MKMRMKTTNMPYPRGVYRDGMSAYSKRVNELLTVNLIISATQELLKRIKR